jgi:hypothetical protein
MFFQGELHNFTIWDSIESSLYYVIVGYYVLIFFYFLLMRFRTSKKPYWFYFSLLFVCLAAGRVFFIIYYFYAPELGTSMSPTELLNVLVPQLMLYYRLATFATWLGIACLMGVLGTLIFPPLTNPLEIKAGNNFRDKVKLFFSKKAVRSLSKIILIIIPIVVAILALTLSDALFMDPDFVDDYGVNPSSLIIIFGYPVGRAVLNFILLPLFVAIIPFMFIYLAVKTYGVLRRSYALNAIGFFLYFLGRILQGFLDTIGATNTRAILPPLLILLSLLIIVIANSYEQLK